MPTIIVQARYESTRFEGKVIEKLMGQPMLLRQLNRLNRYYRNRDVVVALPDTPASKNKLYPILKDHGYKIFIASGIAPNDVLGRFVAASKYESDYIIRLTGDCPLIDPEVVFNAENLFCENERYTALAGNWPDGLDVEVFTKDMLLEAHANAEFASDREHVTPYIWRTQQKQNILPCPYDCTSYNWSVDEESDLNYVDRIYQKLTEKYYRDDFNWQDVLNLMQYDFASFNWATNPKRQRNVAYIEQIRSEGREEENWFKVRYKE